MAGVGGNEGTHIRVSNAEQLTAAIKAAKGGETILLDPGSYDAVSLLSVKVPGGVTIASADPGDPAVLTRLRINDSSGLTFSNLEFAAQDASVLYDFQIANSRDIAFDNIKVHGPAGEAGYTAAPFMIRASQDISVTNSEFSHMRYGISMLDNEGVTLTGNYFHDIRTDGIRGGGNSQVLISENVFTNFAPAPGDHPDAIQFWTTNVKQSAHDITITNNVIVRGEGGAMQGIFISDERGDRPYQNVVIDGNVVLGGMYNGIFVNHADGLSITNNQVAGQPGQKSWIRVNDPEVLSGNAAEHYIVNGANTAPPSGNAALRPPIDGGRDLLSEWAAGRDTAGYHAGARELLGSYQPSPPPVVETPAVDEPGTDDALPDGAILPAPLPVSPPAPQFQLITGTDGADTLRPGKDGDFRIEGGDGIDVIRGGAGLTEMVGGKGNDSYIVNSDRDIVIEEADGGIDTVQASIDYHLPDHVENLRFVASGLVGHGNDLANKMTGTDGVDVFYGGAGDDVLMGMGGDDRLYGGDGDDSLNGGDGDDRLYGEAGNDRLIGGAGDDWMDGGEGDDWLEGGSGSDILTGGRGKDMFNYRQADLDGRDTITDFSRAEGDRIGLSLIDANLHTAKDDPFRFIGTKDFSNKAGELRYSVKDGNTLVEGDIDGDGIADLSILLLGVTSLQGDDFIL